MTIQNPFWAVNRRGQPARFSFGQNNRASDNAIAPAIVFGSPSETMRNVNEFNNRQLKEAHERIRQQRAEQNRRPPRRTGAVRLSNTDSLGRAFQIRSRLLAKLQEVSGSDICPRARDAFTADVKLQLDRVERQIAAIRRRERAAQEERNTRRSEDSPENRRRRFRDMKERRIYIREDYLYHADDGGFCPNFFMEVVL